MHQSLYSSEGEVPNSLVGIQRFTTTRCPPSVEKGDVAAIPGAGTPTSSCCRSYRKPRRRSARSLVTAATRCASPIRISTEPAPAATVLQHHYWREAAGAAAILQIDASENLLLPHRPG
jgi:hypothetical protein